MPENKQSITRNIASKARRELIPLALTLELTPRCSLDCKMCYVHLTKEQMGDRKELSAEQWKKVVDDGIAMGTISVLLTGGECLMHKDFKEIYLYVKSKPVLVTVNTNATLINDEYVEFFAKNPPSKMKISLYGITEEGYERVTGHRMYARVRDNILKLKEAGVNVRLSVTISKQIKDEAADIVKFALDHNIEYTVDMTMFDAEEETGRSADDYSLTADEVVEVSRAIAKVQNVELVELEEKLTEIPKRMDDEEPVHALYCGAGKSYCAVCWDGSFQACLMNKSPDAPNISEVSFEEGWLQATRWAKEQRVPVECKTCEYLRACHSCAIYRMNPNDPGHRNPEVCKITLARLNAGIVTLPRQKSQKEDDTQ